MNEHEKQDEVVISLYGAKVSAFRDGSVWIHRGSRNKRRFGNISGKGYMRVIIRDKGKPRTVFVHTIVALAFLPNPNNKPQINHKNGIKTDNRPENLEWCTNEENAHHRIYTLKRYSSASPVICVETGKEYETISEASRETGINRGNIHRCLKNNSRAGGFHWKRNGGRTDCCISAI